MKQINLLAKYGLTKEELAEGIEIISKNIGKICNVNVMIAIADLLTSGDVEKANK